MEAWISGTSASVCPRTMSATVGMFWKVGVRMRTRSGTSEPSEAT